MGVHFAEAPFQIDPQKPISEMVQTRVPGFYAVSRYLRYKHFGVVWGYRPLGNPPKTNFLTT